MGGGASFASMAMASELTRLGHEIGFLTAANEHGSAAEEEVEGVRLHRVPAFRRSVHDSGICGAFSFICTAATRLPEIMRRGAYDACHYYFGLPTGLLSRIPGSHQKKPYVVSLRGSDVPATIPRLRFGTGPCCR